MIERTKRILKLIKLWEAHAKEVDHSSGLARFDMNLHATYIACSMVRCKWNHEIKGFVSR